MVFLENRKCDVCYCDVVYVENRRCDEFCEAIFFDSMCDEVGWWTGGIL